ncbi:LysE family translocator, partial [Escherichia coli]
MVINTLMVFGATVLPIVFAPGPDILFVSSQGLASGSRAALKANMGVLLGYGMHS